MVSRRGGQGLKSQLVLPRHVPLEACYAAVPRRTHALAHMRVDAVLHLTQLYGFCSGTWLPIRPSDAELLEKNLPGA